MKKDSLITILIAFVVSTLILAIFGIIVYFIYNPNSDLFGELSKIFFKPSISGDVSGDYSGDYSGDMLISGDEAEEEIYLGPKIFSGDSRSVAVMIDNDTSAAWPHAGLNNAYMVYEITVEGSATRLMAVFKKDNLPELIGPIRSCRHYFLDYVQEHDAIYCHFGQSTQGGEALRDRNIEHINGIVDNYYKRIKDVDKTWHNAFSTKELIDKYIASKGFRDTQKQDCIIKYNQKDTNLVSNRIADKVTCRFSGIQTTSFEYDEEAKNYKVTMKNGSTERPHLEKDLNGLPDSISGDFLKNAERYYGTIPSNLSGQKLRDYLAEKVRVYGSSEKPFVAKNILIYRVGNESVWTAWGDHREEDNKKRQELYNTGSGTGYFITNGKAIEMKWSKPSHSAKTTYTDMEGNELTFNDGTTWVEIMPLDGKITIESNTPEISSGDNSGDVSGEIRKGK